MQAHRWPIPIRTLVIAAYIAAAVAAEYHACAAEASADQRVDLYGDVLPAGAVLRLGTIRFRQLMQSHRSVAYSRDGRLLAVTDGGFIVVWEAATGQRVARLSAGKRPAIDEGAQVAFSPRNDELAALLGDGSVHKWETKTWQEAAGFSPLAANHGPDFSIADYLGFAYSPGADMLATNWNHRTIVLDAENGKVLQTLGDNGRRTQFGLAWSPDRVHLASGGFDPPARLWDATSGEMAREFRADFKAFAESLAFSPDGKTLAGGCVEGDRKEIAICLWDVATGKLKAKLESTDPVSLNFTPDGKMLVSATEGGEVDVWDVGSKERVRAFKGAPGIIRNAALSSDGKTLALGVTSNETPQWDFESGQKKKEELVGHSGAVRQVVCSPDSNRIATASVGGDIRVWDAVSGKQLKQMKSSYVPHLAIDPSGKQLAAGGQESGKVHVWDVANGELVRDLDQGEKQVRQVGYTPDGKFLVTVGSDSPDLRNAKPFMDHLHVWDAVTGEHLRRFEVNVATDSSTDSMLILPDNRRVVLGASNIGDSDALQILSLETGAQLAVLHGQADAAMLEYAGSGRFASAGSDRRIRLWDTTTRQSVGVFEGHGDEIKCISFSPDKKWLASCDDAGSIRLWDAKMQKQICGLPKQEYACRTLCFSADGKRLVTGHENGTALVWDVAGMLP